MPEFPPPPPLAHNFFAFAQQVREDLVEKNAAVQGTLALLDQLLERHDATEASEALQRARLSEGFAESDDDADEHIASEDGTTTSGRAFEAFAALMASTQARVRLKRQILALQGFLSRLRIMAVDDFDVKVLQYADAYHALAGQVKHGPTSSRGVSEHEREFIDVFQREMFPESATADPTLHVANTDACRRCGADVVLHNEDSTLRCTRASCGLVSKFVDATTVGVAAGDEVDFTFVVYRRDGHYNDCLGHMQAAENTLVPERVVAAVMLVLYNAGHRVSSEITFAMVRDALKSTGESDFYHQVMQIYCRITNRRAIRIKPAADEMLRWMFARIQLPFDQNCPDTRHNFLSYHYCIYKFCQALGYTELLPFLPILKTKLQEQEEIFKNICRDVGWDFDPVPQSEIDKYEESYSITNAKREAKHQAKKAEAVAKRQQQQQQQGVQQKGKKRARGGA